MKTRNLVKGALFAFGSLLATIASGANNTVVGELYVEPATLINLGFEWRITGDDNHNARVTVLYRKKGTTTYFPGLPWLRLNGERVLSNVRFDVINPNMFAGSIIDLEPDTDYEIIAAIADPDGVSGENKKSITVRTRAEPKPYAGGRVFHVYPHGTPNNVKIQPAFEGLLAAYNNSSSGTDMTMATRPRVRAGDTILVHAGLYKYKREHYTNTASLSQVPFDGTYYLTGTGTADKPIAIKAAGDGEVIFDGNGAFNLFNVKGADYHYFEGLTIRNTEIAIWAGTQRIVGAKGLTVKKTRFENIGMGVYTNHARSSNFYIADNWFIGRNRTDYLISWSDASFANFLGVAFPPSDGEPSLDSTLPEDQKWGSYMAVKTYGPGHVMAYNYVKGFHDGIDNETYGNPEGSFATDPNLPDTTDGPKYPPPEYWDQRPVALDYYNNLMDNFHDNPFEMDGSLHNVRNMRNLTINSASHVWCNQPTLGGPIYWIRNIGYHLPGGTTRGELTGAIFYNNTMLGNTSAPASSNMHWRNNIMLPENVGATLFSVTTNTNYTSSDYNGFGPGPTGTQFQWNSPPFDVLSDQPAPGHTPVRTTRNFATLAAYSAATGQDTHSVVLGYDTFMNVPPMNSEDLAQRTRAVPLDGLDFRLKAGSAAVDRGTAIPQVTDGYTGAAPDLGALEFGAPATQWGPRFSPHWL